MVDFDCSLFIVESIGLVFGDGVDSTVWEGGSFVGGRGLWVGAKVAVTNEGLVEGWGETVAGVELGVIGTGALGRSADGVKRQVRYGHPKMHS